MGEGHTCYYGDGSVAWGKGTRVTMVMVVLGEGHTCYYGDGRVWTEFIALI